MRKLLVVATSFLCAMVAGAALAAPVLIDDFATTQSTVDNSAGAAATSAASTSLYTATIGQATFLGFADRELVTPFTGSPTASIGVYAGAPNFLSATISGVGVARVIWDGLVSGEGPGTVELRADYDLSNAGDNFMFQILGGQAANAKSVYTIFDTAGKTAVFTLLGSAAGVIELTFASAVKEVGFDITHSSSIQGEYTSTDGAAAVFTMSHIRYMNPEPASLATFGFCGLLGLIAARRRNRK